MIDEMVVPSMVWFGPQVPAPVERELCAFLGSHNGVAVLQWPRDCGRSDRLSASGVPRLWLTQAPTGPRRSPDGLDDWVERSADDDRILACLRDLAGRAAAQRQRGAITAADGYLRSGAHGVLLTRAEYQLATLLVRHLEDPVSDDLLSAQLGALDGTDLERGIPERGIPARATPDRDRAKRVAPLTSALIHLGQDANMLGLEVVAVRENAHQLRRCQP